MKVAAVVAPLLALLLVACGSDKEGAERRAAEEADRDARREKVKTAICVKSNDDLFTMATHRFADEAATDNMAVVYVRPRYWGEMNVDQKTVFAGWAALCQRSKDMISIRDGGSGEKITAWTLDGGLR